MGSTLYEEKMSNGRKVLCTGNGKKNAMTMVALKHCVDSATDCIGNGKTNYDVSRYINSIATIYFLQTMFSTHKLQKLTIQRNW